MSVDPTTGLSTAPVGIDGLTTTTKQGTAMGKDDFLKLLVGQLQHQDPMQPADDTQFIGQMAQFSQLEQETNTATATDQLVRTSALSLIGRNVTYTDDSQAPQAGVVSSVNMTADGRATLTVGDTSGIDIGRVTQVR